jgi:hypothetical protein
VAEDTSTSTHLRLHEDRAPAIPAETGPWKTGGDMSLLEERQHFRGR